MPSIATHILAMEETIRLLKESNDPLERNAGEYLSKNKKMACLGAMGPDLFAYADKDFLQKVGGAMSTVHEFGDKLWKAYDYIEEKLEEARASWVPGAATVSETTRSALELIESCMKALSQESKLALIACVNLMAQVAGRFITPAGSSLHGLAIATGLVSDGPILHGKPETKWEWIDLVHSQAPGTFARMFFNAATGREWLKVEDLEDKGIIAYGLGFLSHIATDTTGHAYVNQVVGGPARSHNWRHRLAELTIDKAIWRSVRAEDVGLVSLIDWLNISSSEENAVSEILSKACLALFKLRENGRVCNELRRIKEPPSARDISQFIKNLKAAVRLLHCLEIPLPDPPDAFTYSEALDEATERISEAADVLLPDDIDDIGDVLKGIFGAFVLLCYAIFVLVDDFVASSISQGFAGAQTIVYVVELALYYIYYLLRRFLVYLGFAFPDNFLMQESYAQQFIVGRWPGKYPLRRDVFEAVNVLEAIKMIINSAFGTLSPLGQDSGQSDSAMAEALELRNLIFTTLDAYTELTGVTSAIDRNPLSFPESPVESPTTFPSPFRLKTPNVLLGGKFSNTRFKKYANFNVPQESDNYSFSFYGAISDPNTQEVLIGDPVGFTRFLITSMFNKDSAENALTDWNADSDRGYGYRLWLVPQHHTLLEPEVLVKGYCKNPKP